MKVKLFFLAIFLYSTAAWKTNEVCKKSPFPQTCKQFITMELKAKPPNETTSFANLAFKAAARQADEVGRQLKAVMYYINDGSGEITKQKMAWRDCEELHECSVILLRQAANPNSRLRSNIMTWLSAVLTNLETCRTGFRELGLMDEAARGIFQPISELVTNALNVKTYHSEDNSEHVRDLPSWVSAGDRDLLLSSPPARANVVVASDGSGNFKTITEALEKARKINYRSRFIIHVKTGVYEEYIKISRKLKNIMLIGDGLKNTVITGNRSLGREYTTYRSATFGVSGTGFIAKGIAFRNTAGPQNHQAVAFRSDSDKSVLYQCSFEGHQDTLYVHSQRQFYKECYVYGTVDFIFGNAAAVFQSCVIYARRPMDGQNIVITAQSRTDHSQTTGISIHRSAVMADSDLKPVLGSFRAYLGRPWKQYSRTVFLRSYLGELVSPAGWLPWNTTFALDTLYYGEFGNFGPGADRTERVRWPGYKADMKAADAVRFSAGEFIDGATWLPASGVPFTLKL